MEGDKLIKIKTEIDEKIIELSIKAAERSEILKGMLQDYPDSPELTVKYVKGDDLSKIKEYLEHYKNEEPKEVDRPLKSKDFKECVNEFDYQFVSKIGNYEELKNLILSANFLNIKPLINLLSAYIAHKIKGINTSTIRNTFNIKELNKQEQKQFDEDKAIIEKKEF